MTKSMAPTLRVSQESLDAFALGMLEIARKHALYRPVFALSGILGSGKSTLAHQLESRLQDLSPGCVRVIPLDGFHLSNAELERQGLRHLKGSPQTFDFAAYLRTLEQVRFRQGVVRFPVYDRSVHEPVLRSTPQQTVDSSVRLILTEGNYLLLEDAPWSSLRKLLDVTWMLRTPVEVARERLLQRHVQGGRTPEDALLHYQRCDEPNTQLVLERSREPDCFLE